MKTHLYPKQKFTLLELLIVIAIIMILAALLLQSIGKTRIKAQSINCLSDFRQFGMAFGAYHSDFRDRYPPIALSSTFGWDPELANSTSWNWAWEFKRSAYIPSVKLFVCPTVIPRCTEAIQNNIKELFTTMQNIPNRYIRTSRGYNGAYIGSSVSVAEPLNIPATVRDLKHPSTTLLLAETLSTYYLSPPESTVFANLIQPHLNVCNILWADGHASGEVNALYNFGAPTSVSAKNRKYFAR